MRRLFIVLLTLVVRVGVLHAQADDLDEIFVSSDGTLRFSYSSEWEIEEEGGSVFMASDEFTIGISSSLTIPNRPSESLTEFVESFTTASPDFVFGKFNDVSLDTGVTAVRGDFTYPDQEEGTIAFLLAFEAGEEYILIVTNGENGTALTEIVYAIANTVEFGEAVEIETELGDALILELNGESTDDWEVVVDAMRSLELVDGDGELLFEAEFTSTAMGGPYNISEDSESTYPNSAGGALLSFRPDDQSNNICGFVTRVVPGEEGFEQLLFIGVDAFDNLLITGYGYVDESAEEEALATIPGGVLFHNPTYLHYVLNDNLLTVFVNGEALIEELEVPLPEPSSKGEVAPGGAGAVLEFSCVMTSAWIYGFEAD